MNKFISLTTLALSFAANAGVVVEQPWTRATVPAQKAGGAFMTLKSDQPVSLVGASSPAAKIVEIHEMKLENNVMRMQAVSQLDVVPGKPTELKPGSYHIMMIDLARPFVAGETVPITLEFKGADGKVTKQEVKAEVRDTSGGAAKK